MYETKELTPDRNNFKCQLCGRDRKSEETVVWERQLSKSAENVTTVMIMHAVLINRSYNKEI